MGVIKNTSLNEDSNKGEEERQRMETEKMGQYQDKVQCARR